MRIDLTHSDGWRQVSGKLWCTRSGRYHDGMTFLRSVPYWLSRHRNPLGKWTNWRVRNAIVAGPLVFDALDEVQRVWYPHRSTVHRDRRELLDEWKVPQWKRIEMGIMLRLGMSRYNVARQYRVPLGYIGSLGE